MDFPMDFPRFLAPRGLPASRRARLKAGPGAQRGRRCGYAPVVWRKKTLVKLVTVAWDCPEKTVT